MNKSSFPFIPYGRQSITDDDIYSVLNVLRSDFLTQGPLVPAFEESFCQKVAASHAVAVNSATSALHLACLALNLGPGDILWTSPITFVASANCARFCGAEVDFVDIDSSTGLMSLEKLSLKLESAEKNGTLPKVLVPVHLAGTSCEMEAIASLAARYNFSIIEDASHAVGGRYQANAVGSCIYSDISIFSFHPVKIITSAEGGMATTNNKNLAERMRDLRSHGITKDPSRFEREPDGPWSYEQQCLGYNYRMSDLHAALGISQLKRLDKIVEERHRLLKKYKQELSNLPINFLQNPEGSFSSLHLAVILLQKYDPDIHRQIFESMRAAGIGVQLHYAPVHLQPYYSHLGFKKGDFPSSEAYAHKAISLPIFPGLSDQEQSRVIDSLSQIL